MLQRRIEKRGLNSSSSGLYSSASKQEQSFVSIPRKERCIAPECSRRANLPESVYCNETCVRAYVKNTLKLLELDNTRRNRMSKAPAPQADRVVVFERRSGIVLTGSSSPLASQLEAWLLKHLSFEVLPPGHKIADVLEETDCSLNDANTTNNAVNTQQTLLTPALTSTSGIRHGSLDFFRIKVRKTMAETMLAESERVLDMRMTQTEVKVKQLSTDIEEELFHCFGGLTPSYKAKFCSIICALRELNSGKTLLRQLLNAELLPSMVVHLTNNELGLKNMGAKDNVGPLSLVMTDTTSQHGKHFFDWNCQTCFGKPMNSTSPSHSPASCVMKHNGDFISSSLLSGDSLRLPLSYSRATEYGAAFAEQVFLQQALNTVQQLITLTHEDQSQGGAQQPLPEDNEAYLALLDEKNDNDGLQQGCAYDQQTQQDGFASAWGSSRDTVAWDWDAHSASPSEGGQRWSAAFTSSTPRPFRLVLKYHPAGKFGDLTSDNVVDSPYNAYGTVVSPAIQAITSQQMARGLLGDVPLAGDEESMNIISDVCDSTWLNTTSQNEHEMAWHEVSFYGSNYEQQQEEGDGGKFFHDVDNCVVSSSSNLQHQCQASSPLVHGSDCRQCSDFDYQLPTKQPLLPQPKSVKQVLVVSTDKGDFGDNYASDGVDGGNDFVDQGMVCGAKLSKNGEFDEPPHKRALLDTPDMWPDWNEGPPAKPVNDMSAVHDNHVDVDDCATSNLPPYMTGILATAKALPIRPPLLRAPLRPRRLSPLLSGPRPGSLMRLMGGSFRSPPPRGGPASMMMPGTGRLPLLPMAGGNSRSPLLPLQLSMPVSHDLLQLRPPGGGPRLTEQRRTLLPAPDEIGDVNGRLPSQMGCGPAEPGEPLRPELFPWQREHLSGSLASCQPLLPVPQMFNESEKIRRACREHASRLCASKLQANNNNNDASTNDVNQNFTTLTNKQSAAANTTTAATASDNNSSYSNRNNNDEAKKSNMDWLKLAKQYLTGKDMPKSALKSSTMVAQVKADLSKQQQEQNSDWLVVDKQDKCGGGMSVSSIKVMIKKATIGDLVDEEERLVQNRSFVATATGRGQGNNRSDILARAHEPLPKGSGGRKSYH